MVLVGFSLNTRILFNSYWSAAVLMVAVVAFLCGKGIVTVRHLFLSKTESGHVCDRHRKKIKIKNQSINKYKNLGEVRH